MPGHSIPIWNGPYQIWLDEADRVKYTVASSAYHKQKHYATLNDVPTEREREIFIGLTIRMTQEQGYMFFENIDEHCVTAVKDKGWIKPAIKWTVAKADALLRSIGAIA